jgi:curli biogenesis system outer membrane secretion channel CsgG
MRRFAVLGVLAGLVLLASACAPTQFVKVRALVPPELKIPDHIRNVAVLEFVGAKGTNTVAVKLEQELLNNGFYKVIERAQVAAIINEKNFQQTDLVENDAFLEQMKILSVQGLITGSVDMFEPRSTSGTDMREESYIMRYDTVYDRKGNPRNVPIYGKRLIPEPWQMVEGSVNATFRMVDVGTGQIIASVSTDGSFTTGKVKGGGVLPTSSEAMDRASLDAVVKFIKKVSVWTEVRNIPLKRGQGCADGNNFAASNLFAQAEQEFRAAAAMPGNFAAVYNLGLVLEAQGRFQEAEQTYNQALMMMKTDREIMDALARIQQKIQNEAFLRKLMEREEAEAQ